MKWLTEWAVTSGVLILIMLVVRYLLRDKLSARLRYALWAVVLVRLLVPFQVELPTAASRNLPLVASNFAPDTPQSWEQRDIPMFPTGIQKFEDAGEYQYLEPGVLSSTHWSMGYVQRSDDGETLTFYFDLFSRSQVVQMVWRGGAVVMGIALLISNLCFALRLWRRRKRLDIPGVPVRVYAVEGLPSPCLFGVFRPAVYVIPEAAENPDTLRHVLAHERTHYTHKDHIWSLLRCLALALHWYNPLVWLAVVLSKRDGELACDEGAIARLGEEERISYGRTLVDMVAKRSARPADLLSCSTAMTGGKKSIQQRVARLVKKPETVKAALFATVAVVALSVVFVFAERGQPDNMPTIFFDFLDRTTEIRYSPPLYSSTIYPYPITNEELLAEAKSILTTFVLLDSDGPQPDLTPRKALSEHRITMTFEGGQMEYSLLWQNNHTYLFIGSIREEVFDLIEEEGETVQLLGVSGTCVSEANVISALEDLSRRQGELNRDPSLPKSMFQDELNQYALNFLREIGVTQLQGRPDSMESAVFHAGISSPDSIQLWYRGDAAHNDVWVLELSQKGYAVLADQPIVVFNAARYAGENECYEQLGPGAFAASLRAENVTSVRISQGDETIIGMLTEPMFQTLKDQMVRALYHQISAEYDEEKYGQCSLTIYVEKDVDYYLHDGGEDGLTLSIGSEPDVVCMTHRILASPDSPMGQYVYSPELYQTIQALHGLIPGQTPLFLTTSFNYDRYHSQLSAAQGMWLNSGVMLHKSRVITDSTQLERAKELLALEPLTEAEAARRWDGIWDRVISFTSSPPDADWTGIDDRFYYVSYEEDGRWYILLPTVRDERPSAGIYLGKLPAGNWDTVDKLFDRAPSVDDRQHTAQN